MKTAAVSQEDKVIEKMGSFAKKYCELKPDGKRKVYRVVETIYHRNNPKDFPKIQLNLDEWTELKKIMEEGEEFFIFEPYGSSYIEFGLCIYRHPPFPNTKPVLLMKISGLCLPEELRIEEKEAPGCILDDGFRELSPFSHSEKNIKLLARHNMQKAHDVDHYGY